MFFYARLYSTESCGGKDNLMNSDDKSVMIDNEHDLDKILKTNDRVIALVYAFNVP